MEKEVLLRVGKDALVRIKKKYLTDYVVARNYNEESGSWGHGVYFSADSDSEIDNARCLMSASEYLYNSFDSKYISRERCIELATRFKDALFENYDTEDFMEEYGDDFDMTENEIEFFGVFDSVE